MADDNQKINLPITSQTDQKTFSDDDPFLDVKKEIASRFTLLPKEIQDTLISSEYQMKLFEIAKAQKLTYEQLGSLELATSMVLLGMSPTEDFRDDVKNQLSTDDNTTDAVIQAVSEQVFLPIRQSIEKIYTTQKKIEDTVIDNLSSIESKVSIQTGVDTLKGAGVEIVNDSTNPPFKTQPAPTISQPAPTINLAGTSSMNRDDLLKSIENPPAGTSSKFPSSIPTIQKIAPPPTTPPDPNSKSPITNTPNTVPAAPASVSEQKFVAPMNMPKHETDYSIKPATPAPSATPPRVDPYRENI